LASRKISPFREVKLLPFKEGGVVSALDGVGVLILLISDKRRKKKKIAKHKRKKRRRANRHKNK